RGRTVRGRSRVRGDAADHHPRAVVLARLRHVHDDPEAADLPRLPAGAGVVRVLAGDGRAPQRRAGPAMTLYFAYGANMERAAMRKRCPGATALGIAALRDNRYVIARGYGAFKRAGGRTVFGVLWRLTPRDLAALNLFESLDSGLYRRAMLTVER